jgi:siroheme synthase-like protein
VEQNKLLPIFIKLDTITILVVGGGNVALEKMTGIKKADPLARVKIVGKEIIDEIIELIKDMPNIVIDKKEFEISDLLNINLVISATDDRNTQVQIKKACEERGILCNVADTPDLCDFYLSSVVQKGNLKIAISTNGKSPTIAKRIKEVLEEVFPDEIEDVLQNINIIRKKISGDFSEKVKKLNEITKILIEKGL